MSAMSKLAALLLLLSCAAFAQVGAAPGVTGGTSTGSGGAPTGAAGGDLGGSYPNPTVAKVNGHTAGGTCSNQVTISIDSSARPTCTTITSAFVDATVETTAGAQAAFSGTGACSNKAVTGLNANSTPTCTTLTSAYVDTSVLPMTTLGDLTYENATPAPTRLAGNTTTIKNFLTQTGNGTISGAPVWATIALGDLPAFGPTSTNNGSSSGSVSPGCSPTTTCGSYGGTAINSVWAKVSLNGTGLVVTGTTTVASLPSASANIGGMVRVSDSTSVSAEGQTCVGSSSNVALAFSNGTVWKCF